MKIEIQSAHKQFGSFVALNQVSVDIQSGQLTALLGPSGCGKTTLLRSIAGLENLDQGHIFFNGEDISKQAPGERKIGFVFQHYALFKHLTVFENVAFGLRVKQKKERPNEDQIKEKVHELLDLVQLDWLGHRYPSELSGGQRQRIALARALAIEPQVLLLDEPFGALDTKVRENLRRWLRKMHDQLHITSIFVTHDQEEAMSVADQIVLMDHGQVVQVGSPQTLYYQPNNEFVYTFLGMSNRFDFDQMNQIRSQEKIKPLSYQGIGFVRPHDIDLISVSSETEITSNLVPARVKRVIHLLGRVQIELSLQHQIKNHTDIYVDISSYHPVLKEIETHAPIFLKLNQVQWFDQQRTSEGEQNVSI
jgi:sulfate transport system ATP-binding protein